MAKTLREEVLSAAAGGNPEALRGIYDALAPSILAYLTGKGCEDPEAQTQEVFLTVFGKLDTLTGGLSGMRTFAFSVAHARMVDDVRRRERQPLLAEFQHAHDVRVSASAEQTVLESGAGVAALLEGLTPRQQEVLLLRVVGDQSIGDTARIMGCSEGAVKQLQSRALKILKDRLERERKEAPAHERIA
ncbi:RNA polymerase sigma factor [Arthrobacter sp. ATA002]|uniref:RNA polymerase sigma factor n=1 Tax=Arthrobacter sp. ATA002 TaxID=2991715 RepID=UPI0022A6AFE4|nr:RNA polymerase sigma factor [Arthrobacter sp. ATA002]WAP51841.1 RNA polymerase sigma factor [Arthrobacter sp. ATA002]